MMVDCNLYGYRLAAAGAGAATAAHVLVEEFCLILLDSVFPFILTFERYRYLINRFDSRSLKKQ